MENSLHISQEFIRVGLGIKAETGKILHLEINPLVEEEIKVEIGEIIIIETITDPVIETNQEADATIISQVIGVTITRLTIGKVILDQIMDKMLNRHLGTEVKVEIELESIKMTIQEVEVENRYNDRSAQSCGRDESRSRSSSSVSTNCDHVRCYRCRGIQSLCI